MTRLLIIICIVILLFQFISHADENNIKHSIDFSVMGSYKLGHLSGYNLDGVFDFPSYDVINLPESTYDELKDPGRSIGSSWGGAEIKVLLNYGLSFPFLVGEGPLFSGNNIEVNLTGELSPVSLAGGASITFTPIALIKLSIGASAGTGWAIGFNGLGRNIEGIEKDSPQEESFSGIVANLWASGTLQFDLGAVIPGKWTHVVMQVTPKIRYLVFTGADDDTAWVWEADEGENFNGIKYTGTYFIGYLMPLVLDTVGILVETEQYIDADSVKRSKSADADWKSDFMRVRFGPLFNFVLSNKMSLALLPQFRTAKKYTDNTIGNRYFEYREYESTYFYFERLAFFYNIKL